MSSISENIFDKRLPSKFLFFFFLTASVIFDQLNGLGDIFGFSVPFSQVLRLAYLILGMWILFKWNLEKLIISLTLFLVLVFPSSIQFIFFGLGQRELFSDIIFVSKTLIVFVFLYGAQYIFRNIPKDEVIRYLQVPFWLAFMGLMTAVLTKTGVSTYRIGIGTKGYFLAGNELSALFIPLYSAVLYNALRSKKLFSVLVYIIAGAVFAGLVLTKTILFGYILISISLPLLYRIEQKRNTDAKMITRRLFRLFLFIVVLIFFVGSTLLVGYVEEYFGFLSSNRETADNFFTFILSRRDVRTGYSFSIWMEQLSDFERLFGLGWERYIKTFRTFDNPWGTTEIDFFDYLFGYGVFGLASVLVLWITTLYKSYTFFLKKISFSSVGLLSSGLFFTLSFISGHIFYSAMSVYYLAIVLGIVLADSEYGDRCARKKSFV